MVRRPTDTLSAEKALIFRIVHRDNLDWILDNGLHCRSSSVVDPGYVNIGNADLIERRNRRAVPVPPNGTLSDYIPFYFTPYSPMLLNIKTGWGDVKQRPNTEIIILVSSLHELNNHNIPFVFTDRHAYLQAANYFNEMEDLHEVDFALLRTRDFQTNPDDPGKKERYQAEALVYQTMPTNALLGIICYDDLTTRLVQTTVESRNLDLRIVTKPTWYF